MTPKNSHFLDHPDVKDHFDKVFPIIIEESDRGAVLLAASQVDLILEKALKTLAPTEMSNNKLNPIFSYTGPLGTFSSKINMAYYFRIINKDVWSALHCLRDIRNTVAHDCITFTIESEKSRIEKYYDFGRGVHIAIHNESLNLLMNSVVGTLLDLDDPRCEEKKKIFNTPTEVLDHIQSKPDLMEKLKERLPKWKLAYGTAIISGVIHHGAQCAIEVLGDNGTFLNLNKKV